jgi:hypothetical protein
MQGVDQGQYGTCAIHAFIDVVQEQVQLRYGVTLDTPNAIAKLEWLNAEGKGVDEKEVADAINADGFKFKPWSHDGYWFRVKVTIKTLENYLALVEHVKANVGDSCAHVCIKTDEARHASHAVAAYNHYGEENNVTVVARNSWRGQAHYDVTDDNYVDHTTMTVEIVQWTKDDGNVDKKIPAETPRYTSTLAAATKAKRVKQQKLPFVLKFDPSTGVLTFTWNGMIITIGNEGSFFSVQYQANGPAHNEVRKTGVLLGGKRSAHTPVLPGKRFCGPVVPGASQ